MMMILRRHHLRRRSHQLRFSISSIYKVRFLHRRITRRRKKLRFSYPRRRQKERRPPPLSRPKAHEALKACVCGVSSVLSSLCDETEVVKKRKILAGKKFVREARVPKRERWSSYRAALSEWYFYFYYDFKVTLWI